MENVIGTVIGEIQSYHGYLENENGKQGKDLFARTKAELIEKAKAEFERLGGNAIYPQGLELRHNE